VTRTASPSVRTRLADAPTAQDRLELGVSVDRYEVIELVGEGGMGKVYRARDTELGREVALKWIDPRRYGATRAQRLLRREAQAMARVEHPAVVRIYDVGVANEHLFVAMELVRGGPLGDWLGAQPRTWREVLGVFVEAGRGLAAAHRAGLVHRDIKPSNMLLDEHGRPKISDFGLARTLDDRDADDPTATSAPEPRITRTGALVGTPAYMAPEQLAGAAIDARADQFAFCAALWEALCGKRPFRLDDVGQQSLDALLSAIRAGSIVPPTSDVRPPRRVLAVLRRGLASEPDQRWPSMDALLDALDRAARRRRGLAIAGAGLAVAIAAIVWGLSGRGDPPLRILLPRLVASAESDRVAVTMLRDSRYVRLDDNELSLIASGDLQRTAIAVPPGVVLGTMHASAAAGWLEVRSRGPGCRWWHAPVDGGAWRALLDDPSCSARVSVSPDGRTLAIAQGRDVRIRDRATGVERIVARMADSPSMPEWSPDGTRLAIELLANTMVIDASTGAVILDPMAGVAAQWLDRDRLIYVGIRTWTRSEVRVYDLRHGTDRLLHEADGRLTQIAVSRDGVLIGREVLQGEAMVGPASPPHALAIDELTPLHTGAEIDFLPLAWHGGAVITLGVTIGQRGLIRTAPGQHGEPLVLHRRDSISFAGRSLDHMLYDITNGDTCEVRMLDLATGSDRAVPELPCKSPSFLHCAPDQPRCILADDKTARWFDAQTLTLGDPAPWVSLHEVLSPDGRETVQLRGDQIVVRTLADNAETTIALSPAVAEPGTVEWGNDAGTLIVQTVEPARARVLIVSRDGHWRAAIDDAHHRLNGALLSPDGKQLAIVALRTQVTWSLLPFAAPDGP